MSRFRPRLRALAALVALCLSVGPAASALCPHAEASGHQSMGHDGPMEHARTAPEAASDVPPCHEAPAPEPESEDADCASPCCATATAPAPAPPPGVELSVSAVLPARLAVAEVRPAEATVEGRVPPRAPPDGAHLRTVRLRV